MKRCFSIIIYIAFNFAGLSFLFAQTDTSTSNAPIIKSVKYEGLIYISPTIAHEISQIKIGEKLDREQVDESIMNFYKQGYFEDIWVSEDNGVLTYHFTEKPSIAKIEVNGYGSGADAETLSKEIGIKKGDTYDEVKIQKVKQKIISILEAKGYYDTIVETQTEPVGEKAIKLIINVNQGEEIIIKQADYKGAQSLSPSQIETVTINREAEFLGWLWGFNNGKLHVNELENDSRRIKDYYMRKGFLDAQVNTPLLEADFDNYQAKLSYNIEEGEIYYVGGVDIELDNPVIETTILMESLILAPAKRFNIESVRKDIEHIREIIGDLGYAFVRVDPQLDTNKERSEVFITYKISTGNKVYINDVLISGNTRTLDRVIRREITFSPGELYQASKLKVSRNSLTQLGFFDNIEIEEKRVGENSLDILVKVSETFTGELLFGLGYGAYDGLIGNLSAKERNAFGSGITFGVYADKSKKEGSYRLNIYNPRVLDSRYSLSSDIYKRDYITYDYTENSAGIALTAGRRFFDYVHATLGYAYIKTELTDFSGNLAELYQPYFLQGFYTKSSIIPGLNFDSTDDYYFPRSGISASSFIEFAGIGGDEDFIKYFGRFVWYNNLDDFDDVDIIFRIKGRAGFIDESGYLPINEKFYLGGSGALRGYRSNSVTPLGTNGVRIGGKYMALGSVETSFGLFEAVRMRFMVFFDYGIIGQNSFSEIQRSSVGAGIEWVSPLGPLSFVFPFALNLQPGDKRETFEFNMGTRF